MIKEEITVQIGPGNTLFRIYNDDSVSVTMNGYSSAPGRSTLIDLAKAAMRAAGITKLSYVTKTVTEWEVD